MRSNNCTLLSSSVMWASLPKHRLLTAAWQVVGCGLLVSLGAQVRVPVPGTDVPATLQLLAVLFTGLVLRPAPAAAAMLLYLACGTLGLPVFALGSMGLVGATGGYLVGFVFAAFVVSLLRGVSDACFVRRTLAATVGALLVFVFGVAWRVVLAWSTGLFDGAVLPALAAGFVPFAAKTAVEVLLATMLVTAVHGRRRLRPAAPTLRTGG